MAWLDILWNHRSLSDNEANSADEVCYQFAIITVIDGVVNLHPHNTGNLNKLPNEVYESASDTVIPTPTIFLVPGYWGRIRSQVFVPNMDNPYVGVCMRGIERDASSSGNRRKEYNNFVNAVKNRAEEIVGEGRLPTPAELTEAGRSVGLIDRTFRDDDDLIGVDSIVSTAIGRANRIFDGIRNTEILEWTNIERLRMEGCDTLWRPEIACLLRFGDPGTIRRYETRAYRGTIPNFPDP